MSTFGLVCILLILCYSPLSIQNIIYQVKRTQQADIFSIKNICTICANHNAKCYLSHEIFFGCCLYCKCNDGDTVVIENIKIGFGECTKRFRADNCKYFLLGHATKDRSLPLVYPETLVGNISVGELVNYKNESFPNKNCYVRKVYIWHNGIWLYVNQLVFDIITITNVKHVVWYKRSSAYPYEGHILKLLVQCSTIQSCLMFKVAGEKEYMYKGITPNNWPMNSTISLPTNSPKGTLNSTTSAASKHSNFGFSLIAIIALIAVFVVVVVMIIVGVCIFKKIKMVKSEQNISTIQMTDRRDEPSRFYVLPNKGISEANVVPSADNKDVEKEEKCDVKSTPKICLMPKFRNQANTMPNSEHNKSSVMVDNYQSRTMPKSEYQFSSTPNAYQHRCNPREMSENEYRSSSISTHEYQSLKTHGFLSSGDYLQPVVNTDHHVYNECLQPKSNINIPANSGYLQPNEYLQPTTNINSPADSGYIHPSECLIYANHGTVNVGPEYKEIITEKNASSERIHGYTSTEHYLKLHGDSGYKELQYGSSPVYTELNNIS